MSQFGEEAIQKDCYHELIPFHDHLRKLRLVRIEEEEYCAFPRKEFLSITMYKSFYFDQVS